MTISVTPIFHKHQTTIYLVVFFTLQNIMFNKYSNEQPLPFPFKPNPNKPYYISKTDVERMAQCITEQERRLKTKEKNSHKEKEKTEIAMISLEDDDMETIYGIEEIDLEQPIQYEQLKRKQQKKNEPQCVEIPTINIEASNIAQREQDKDSIQTGDESMLNYKINRQRYHSFCQNQAIKQEQAKKQRKQRRVSRKGECEEGDRKLGKTKTWKAEATSIKKILSTSNQCEKPSKKESKQVMTVIQKDTIPSMYQLSPTQAYSVGYSSSPNQDPFFSSVFEFVKADMQYARIYKLRESNLSKIRTFIVRRILDDFVAQRHQDSPEQREHLARHNRRITRFDRNRYLQAGINEPPSRMKSQYLQDIFQNQPFCDYYINYLTSQRLKRYMEESNEEIRERFWQDILTISKRETLSLNQKVTLFKEIKRKPLFRSQIAEYLEEGNMIRIEYCKQSQ